MRFLGFWFVIELINGVGHRLWSIQHRRYTPGVITALVLLVLGWYYFGRSRTGELKVRGSYSRRTTQTLTSVPRFPKPMR
jgi:hypothetical protein